MTITKKKFNSYILINCFLVVIAISSFIFALCINHFKQDNNYKQEMDINSIAPFIRFLTIDPTTSILELAFHNFSLAFIAYILSMFSFGILGIFSLCSAFYIAGIVVNSSFNFLILIFTILEVAGMCLSVFGGVYIFNKRRKYSISLNEVFVFSAKLILTLMIIYFLAACVETYFIQNMMKGYSN